MKKGKYIVKTVPATTNNITKGIINFLNSEGHVAVRINVQGQWDEEKQCWRKSGSTTGVLDISCCLAPSGRLLVIDVKKGNDKLSDEQGEYARAVIAAGGIAYFAPTLSEFIKFYSIFIKPQLQR